MALAKKRSRQIIVDNQIYDWSISPDSGYFVIIIQDGNGSGAKLIVYKPWIILKDTIEGQAKHPEIGPGLISALILQACQMGWKPREKGSDFICDLTDQHNLTKRS